MTNQGKGVSAEPWAREEEESRQVLPEMTPKGLETQKQLPRVEGQPQRMLETSPCPFLLWVNLLKLSLDSLLKRSLLLPCPRTFNNAH